MCTASVESQTCMPCEVQSACRSACHSITGYKGTFAKPCSDLGTARHEQCTSTPGHEPLLARWQASAHVQGKLAASASPGMGCAAAAGISTQPPPHRPSPAPTHPLQSKPACPAQVMQWLQAACAMGHAFCGPAGGAGTLHRLVMQHGAASFQRMHSGNLETLHSLLERELWRGVPLPPSQSAATADTGLEAFLLLPGCTESGGGEHAQHWDAAGSVLGVHGRARGDSRGVGSTAGRLEPRRCCQRRVCSLSTMSTPTTAALPPAMHWGQAQPELGGCVQAARAWPAACRGPTAAPPPCRPLPRAPPLLPGSQPATPGHLSTWPAAPAPPAQPRRPPLSRARQVPVPSGGISAELHCCRHAGGGLLPVTPEGRPELQLWVVWTCPGAYLQC